MELLVFAILLTLTGAQESQLEGSENTMSFVGLNVTLKCLSPSRNCNGIEWLIYIAGKQKTVFRYPGGISSSYRDRYSVDQSSGCALVIENVELTDAGRFLCRAIISSTTVEKSAYLIILEAQPKCHIYAALDSTVEKDGVGLTCQLTYNGTSRASMIWKGVDDAPAAVEYGKTISRSYSVVASVPEVPSFTCATSFPFETKDNGAEIVGLATNSIPVPTCATPAIKVLYSVRNVTLSPSRFYYSLGSVITCTAKGHPLPSVNWQEMENDCIWVDIQNQTTDVFTTSIVTFKRFRCVATNVVRGKSYKATSHQFQFNNTEIKDKLSSTNTSDSQDRLGIGIGIGLLVAILLSTIAFAILVKFRYLEFHPRPTNKALDGGAEHMDHEMNPSPQQPLVMNRSTPRTENPLIGDQESAYATLGEADDPNEYKSLEQRQKAKPEEESRP